jgi:hypothetical protein
MVRVRDTIACEGDGCPGEDNTYEVARIVEQVLAIISRRINTVGELSLEGLPPAGDDVLLSLDSLFAPRS